MDALLNILAFATALAMLEIWLERYRSGFGGDFIDPYWSEHMQGPFIEFLKRVAGKQYIKRYHYSMFGFVLPALYAGEWAVLAWHGHGGLAARLASPLMLMIGVCAGVMVVEDFLYFLLIGLFAKRLLPGKGFDEGAMLLLKGKVAWHTDWRPIAFGLGLPTSYFIGLGIAFFSFALRRLIFG
ncbi:MAG: hypothetical protein KGI69_01370 [Patescibacteria group bacterium]|nr:hypothetical protein [Patescibacteria group bacterium]